MDENTERKAGGQFIQLGEAKLRYYESGEGETVLFIHAYGQAMFTFRRNVTVLSEYCRVISIDLPGHGLSDSIDWDYTVENYTQILIDFMEAMGIHKATLVGNGTGAMLALNIALKKPEAVTRLILLSPGGVTKSYPLSLRMLRKSLFGDLAFTFYHKSQIKKILSSAYFDPTFLDKRILRHYEKIFANKEQLDAMISSFMSYKGEEITEALSDIAVPAYIFWGENDEWHRSGDIDFFEDALPEVVVATIPECGHFPHEEKADEFNKKLIEILSRKAD